MRETVDFVVMGAGVIGLCTALALQQRGHQVVILEAGTIDILFDAPSPRVYALNLASQILLQKLGVWGHVQAHCAPYERMHVWDAQSSAQIDFDARILARDRLGVILEESYLKQALLQEVQASQIQIVTNWQTQALTILENKIVVSSAQASWQAEFLAVTDGARSSTRDELNVPMTTWPYHQHAIVAKVKVEQSHSRTAYQVFCEQGPLAFLPMQDPNCCSIVWSSAVAHAEQLMALSDQDFSRSLEQAFEHKLGAVTILSERKSYPLHMQHVQQYVGSRWFILGDAGHTIHPLAGLGLNLGLADVTTLLRLWQDSLSKTLSASVLRAYQRHRKHELWQMIVFLQGMHRLFTQTYLPIKLLRRFGLHLCDRLPMVKRLLMEHASGVTQA